MMPKNRNSSAPACALKVASKSLLIHKLANLDVDEGKRSI